MRQPCCKDCPGRAAECKIRCPKWTAYQESLKPARAAREREQILNSYGVEALQDTRRRYGWRRGRKPKL